jgi:hypothetical protein
VCFRRRTELLKAELLRQHTAIENKMEESCSKNGGRLAHELGMETKQRYPLKLMIIMTPTSLAQ